MLTRYYKDIEINYSLKTGNTTFQQLLDNGVITVEPTKPTKQHFYLVRNPYQRLESFYKFNVLKTPIWQNTMIHYFLHNVDRLGIIKNNTFKIKCYNQDNDLDWGENSTEKYDPKKMKLITLMGPTYEDVIKLIGMGWDDTHTKPHQYDFDLIKEKDNHHLVDIKNNKILEDALGFKLPHKGNTSHIKMTFEYTKEMLDIIDLKYKRDFEMYEWTQNNSSVST